MSSPEKKPDIIVTIMPTYICTNGCWYCYIRNNPSLRVHELDDTDAYFEKVSQLLEEISAKYNIQNIEMYGGEIALYGQNSTKPLFSRALARLIDLAKDFAQQDVIITTIYPAEIHYMYGIPFENINISLNVDRADFEQRKQDIISYPDVNVITVATPQVVSFGVDCLLDLVKPLRGYLTMLQYSLSITSTPGIGKSNLEYNMFMLELFEKYVQNKKKYKFKLSNLILAKDCTNGLYSVACSNNIFITPSAQLACIDFTMGGAERFISFNTLSKWEASCKLEEYDRIRSCGTCDFYNNCFAEHFRPKICYPVDTYINGDICNGNFPQVIWAKEHARWI